MREMLHDFIYQQLHNDATRWFSLCAAPTFGSIIELEELIKSGIRVFSLYRAGDERWSRDVQDATTKFDRQIATEIRAFYERWNKSADFVAPILATFEEYSFINHADEFRNARRLTRTVLRIPLADLITGMEEAEKAVASC